MGILDLLFPVSCLNCRRPAEAGAKEGGYFCSSCLSKVQVLNHFDPVSQTFSIFRYEGVVRKGIIKIKYNFAYDIANELSEICFENCKFLPAQARKLENCILVPIPLHPNRERWRGFNQSEILGKLIAEKLGWGFNKDILIRPVGGQNQVGLAKSERVRNIRGKYAVNAQASAVALAQADQTFIVFDDVATTGSTIKEAIKVLKKAGAKHIIGLTVAR